ncbi:kinase mug58-like protein 1 [Phlyctema vagabunda]|uniref:Kinase mug58-like protein 1 n=1 Tax=Phlyctema vagabunda TaxID=108571 RepID=A0ABR4P4R5_9HELO
MADTTSPNAVPAVKPTIVDDKSPICIPFILAQLKTHQAAKPDTPFFIALNGVQGAGKTTLVSALATTLREKEGLETLVCSIDDLYLKHGDQVALATGNPLNPLVQHRGEPGTHDMTLAREFFTALKSGQPTKIPQYDKSQFNGHGDRVPSSKWQSVNEPGQPPIRVIIFEGWSVGFRALTNAEVEAKASGPSTTLHKHRLEDLLFVNDKLREYDVMTDCFDAFIHVDAEETKFVYDWRLQQEAMLRREKGSGMTDEQVVHFVDGYYPAYELYTQQLRDGVFRGQGKKGAQLRLVVGKDRKVKHVYEI